MMKTFRLTAFQTPSGVRCTMTAGRWRGGAGLAGGRKTSVVPFCEGRIFGYQHFLTAPFCGVTGNQPSPRSVPALRITNLTKVQFADLKQVVGKIRPAPAPFGWWLKAKKITAAQCSLCRLLANGMAATAAFRDSKLLPIKQS